MVVTAIGVQYNVIMLDMYCAQVMKDQMGNTESERKSSYFERPWCQEAIPRYFYAKVSQRKSELEQALGIRHP